MNTKKTEEIAVATIKREIYRSDYLSDEIPVNDKTPSWDGEIWVYESRNQKKKDLFGKVPVQVKGTNVKAFSDNEINYSLKKVDLENYYKNGGIIFFVVEVIDVDHTKIYYLSLLPIDIKEILEEMKEQKSITKCFKMLTNASRALEFICRNFIHHSRKQGFSLVNNFKGSTFDGLGGAIISADFDSVKNDLLEYGTYLYGRIEKHNLEIPLYKLDIDHILEDTIITIGVNGINYYDKVVRKIDKEKITLLFGESFKIEFSKQLSDMKQININFNESGNIRNRIKDCNFMLELVKHKHIEINNNPLTLNKYNKEHQFLEELPGHIKELEEILETFKQLNISFDIDLSKLSKDDFDKIEVLKEVILYKNYSRLKLVEGRNFVQFLIGNLKIVLLSIKMADGWLVFNLFDLDAINNNFKVLLQSEDLKEKAKHSPYLVFEISEFLSLSNLDVNVIEKSLIQVEYNNQFSINLTINYLLKILSYYDAGNNRKELLNLAYNVFEHLESIVKEDNILFFLNKMQAIKRLRNFSMEEKEEIIKRKNLGIYNDDVMCGFFILLESKVEFEIQFNKLSESQKEIFRTYPIYNLIEEMALE